MGRRKQTVTEPELTEADVEPNQAKTPRQVVEAEHTIRFRKPLDVATLEPETEEELDVEDFEEPEIEEPDDDQPRRRTALSFRAKLKKELSERGIGSDEQLRLRIDRLPYYDVNGNTGINAEKEFVRNIPCAKQFVINDEYLDEVSKSCGPGAYWFTLRHKNTIVKMWHMKISGPPIAPATAAIAQLGEPAAQATAGAPPIYQPQFAPHVPGPRSLKQELKDLVEMKRMMKELSDDPPPAPPPLPAADPEVILLQSLANNEKFMDKISSGLVGKVLGGHADDEPSLTAVAMEAVKNGQVAATIESLGRVAINLIDRFLPASWRNNGQAPMATTTVQNQTRPVEPQQPGQLALGQEMGQAANPGDGAGGVAGDVHQHLTPADELIYSLIALMERQATISEAQQIINVAIFRAPELRESIDELINFPIDQILALVTAYHPPVAEMTHAREWLNSLVAMLTVN